LHRVDLSQLFWPILSLRDGFTVYFVLSSVTGLLPPSSAGYLPRT
jgi:hypothetical protein